MRYRWEGQVQLTLHAELSPVRHDVRQKHPARMFLFPPRQQGYEVRRSMVAGCQDDDAPGRYDHRRSLIQPFVAPF